MIKNNFDKTSNNEEATQSQSFFKAPEKKSRVLKEEKYLNAVYKKLIFDDIKKDLGEGYNDQDAENVLEMIIAKHKSDGTYKKILDEYLENKIQKAQSVAGISSSSK